MSLQGSLSPKLHCRKRAMREKAMNIMAGWTSKRESKLGGMNIFEQKLTLRINQRKTTRPMILCIKFLSTARATTETGFLFLCEYL